ncbi:MAG TPA: hypothetical protein VGB24_21580 [Longimicrobium sp.]|uniref:hypothetical protein n=1 Tax=Longimicrobium sp. TaxID=2029185 RepID=UPI002ED88E10
MALVSAALVLGPTPAAAQVPDTAGLAQAVGAFLVETVVPQVGRRNRLEVSAPSTAFDSAVAVFLQAAPEAALPPRRGYRNWIVTRHLDFRGDTAVVLVEQGTGWPAPVDDPYALTFFVDQNNFFFVRDPAGWRYVRRAFHSHADGGAVRG